MPIKKILVANRGEIALRIMRSAKEMGIKTVAVYTEVDRKLPHASYANESYCIGKDVASDSYLSFEKIIAVCKEANVDAIHPGYGFLSENAQFAEEVEKNNMIFIGPSARSIRVMGDKLASKNAVKNFDVPQVPGMSEPINDVEKAKKIAKDIGYPILIKASAGGGGKGMRIVSDPSEFESRMQRAMSEAKSAFGSDEVFIEKYFNSSKHIEIQLLGDKHGNYVYLFERDCSIQRRHQKVIEEAPAPLVDEQKRKQLGESAINVARACGYHGAGTVEFIADEHMNFYFLEMNTRLQVEHPVSEMISGIDLVKEQIKIANGEQLSFTQKDLKIHGHSLEIRVYAEDVCNEFLPDTGKLIKYSRPQGPGIRVDDGFEEGNEISVYYDPMIAKLIAHGKDRKEAIMRMLRAIEEYKIIGVKTTLPFCEYVLGHPAFLDGTFNTKFVEKYHSSKNIVNDVTEEIRDVATIVANTLIEEEKYQVTPSSNDNSNKYVGWKSRIKKC